MRESAHATRRAMRGRRRGRKQGWDGTLALIFPDHFHAINVTSIAHLGVVHSLLGAVPSSPCCRPLTTPLVVPQFYLRKLNLRKAKHAA